MGFFTDILANPLFALAKEQDFRDLLTTRRFRITEEFLQGELATLAGDEELSGLSLKLHKGYGELAGKLQKKPIPFAIPFSARFSLAEVQFTPESKHVRLRIDEMKPVNVDWLTERMLAKTDFMDYADGIVSCDLAKVPRLAGFFGLEVKGVRVADYLELRELAFEKGAITGRFGICI